eukprot:GFUD01099846.1.p1 GENE.GFUD01099846.1~~GFUD01099846.1.p1  ORF type:complete len:350 (+),score=60.74 GFUD01099846.1:57-1052(+)
MAFRKHSVVLSVVLISVLVLLVFYGGDQLIKKSGKDEMTDLFTQKDDEIELSKQNEEKMELFKKKDENIGLFRNLFRKKDKMMELFRQKDVTLVDDVLKMDPKTLTETEAMHKFYNLVALPLQGVCRVHKHIGGRWFVDPLVNSMVDGDYCVCMDNILVDMDKPCLVYSFGVADDWNFEDIMDSAGCEVHAHDPSVDYPAERGENTHFYKLGLGAKTEQDMDTLGNILKKNGHNDTTIDFLKMDIETFELTVLPELIASGTLNNVNQLAMEFHLTELHEGPNFIWLLEILQQLYKLTFRVISHKVNALKGPGKDQLYSLVEVTFMKDNVWN